MDKITQLYTQWQDLQPVSDSIMQRLRRKFMLEFNYNSNHIEGNTLTYGQTEILLLFDRVIDSAAMKDLEDMKASNIGLNMMQHYALDKYPLTEKFVRELHKTILRADYEEYRTAGGRQYHYTVHAGIYKTRPNSVITRTGERFEYASPEETPALMKDLIDWYRDAEQSGKYTIAELCALFHYRYIRIHPFEDGNGRIARLLVNYILARHHYPMIVIKTADRENYLKALGDCDGFAGTAPSAGAHANVEQIRPFVVYIERCIERALTTCIKAAKGEIIAEDNDYAKELRILELHISQKETESATVGIKTPAEVRNVFNFVFLPIADKMRQTVDTSSRLFAVAENTVLLSNTMKETDGTPFDIDAQQDTALPDDTESLWYIGNLSSPRKSLMDGLSIEKKFFIAFFHDHYFVDGILNKNFPYGKYPTDDEKQQIISQFEQDILQAIKNKVF